MTRRRTSLATRCVQGVATPALLAAVAVVLHWLGVHVLGGR